MIKDIKFQDQKSLSPHKLQVTAQSLIGQNLFKISESDVRNLFLDFSRIKNINIKRKLFNTLIIKIEERIPSFQINTSDGKLLLVDQDAMLLSDTDFSNWEDLPTVTVDLASKELAVGNLVKDDFLAWMLEQQPYINSAEPDFFNYISQIFMFHDQLVMTDYQQGYWIILDQNNLIENIKEYMEIKNTCSFDCQTQIDMTFENNYRVTKREK